jgi:hypothetical protein
MAGRDGATRYYDHVFPVTGVPAAQGGCGVDWLELHQLFYLLDRKVDAVRYSSVSSYSTHSRRWAAVES